MYELESLKPMDNRKAVEVTGGGTVKFSFFAPNAKKVQVEGISGSMKRGKVDLEPEGKGYFSKEISGIERGFHYHDYYVDDVMVRNPEGLFCYGCFSAINYFELPDETDEFWKLKNIPHGDLNYEIYLSKVNNRMKQCIIYTPPGYKKNKDRYYPVLYLQHGVGENETGWINNGKMNFILDNLIEQKKCYEMIVVINSGYAFKKGEDAVFLPGDFDRQLVDECVPFVDNKYRTIKSRDGRAVAGLSLGSAQALDTAVKHQDMFSYLGMFSGAAPQELDKIIEGKMSYNKIFLSAGKGEKELCELLPIYKEKLEKAGISSEFHSYHGFHEWSAWRESLRDFVSMLFKTCDDFQALNKKAVNQDKYSSKVYEQWTESDALFFDPVYKNIEFKFDNEGRPLGTYIDIPHGSTVLEDGRVRISFQAPDAKKVEVHLFGKEPIAMKKDDNGCFFVEMQNLIPGFYYYDILVNGTETVNLQAPVAFLKKRAVNFLEIPQRDFEEYMLRDVPHGSLHRCMMYSKMEEAYKACYVYTPSDYENTDKMYPVIYLWNNENEDETAWIYQGKLNNIMDNMIYDGKCTGVIVVIVPQNIFRQDEAGVKTSLASDNEIIEEVKMFINEKYRVKNQCDNNIFGREFCSNRAFTDWTIERKRFAEYVSEIM